MMMTRIMELSKYCAEKIARKKSCSWNAEISTISTNGLSKKNKQTIASILKYSKYSKNNFENENVHSGAIYFRNSK